MWFANKAALAISESSSKIYFIPLVPLSKVTSHILIQLVSSATFATILLHWWYSSCWSVWFLSLAMMDSFNSFPFTSLAFCRILDVKLFCNFTFRYLHSWTMCILLMSPVCFHSLWLIQKYDLTNCRFLLGQIILGQLLQVFELCKTEVTVSLTCCFTIGNWEKKTGGAPGCTAIVVMLLKMELSLKHSSEFLSSKVRCKINMWLIVIYCLV